jgi:hypothetical protein
VNTSRGNDTGKWSNYRIMISREKSKNLGGKSAAVSLNPP